VLSLDNLIVGVLDVLRNSMFLGLGQDNLFWRTKSAKKFIKNSKTVMMQQLRENIYVSNGIIRVVESP
jgi:hypothetical protein